MITTKYGRRYVPSTGAAVVVGLFSVSTGLIWMMMTLALASRFGGVRGRSSAFWLGIRRRRRCDQLLPIPKGETVWRRLSRLPAAPIRRATSVGAVRRRVSLSQTLYDNRRQRPLISA